MTGTPTLAEDGDLGAVVPFLDISPSLAGFWIERREIVTLTRPRTEDELRAELERVEAEIAKRKNGEVVELHAVDGGKDGQSA